MLVAPGQHLGLEFFAHFFSLSLFWIDSVNSIWVKRIFFKASDFGFGRLCLLASRLTEASAPQLKGHCAGGQQGETGRVSVILEQGDPLQMIQLLQSPWEDRFRVSHVYFRGRLLTVPTDEEVVAAERHQRRTFETPEGPTSVPQWCV